MKGLVAQFVIPAVALLCGVAHGGDSAASRHQPPTDYDVVNLPSLGGTSSSGNSINPLGLVAGYSNLTGDESAHATLWLYGFSFDLGTLGGPNSNVAWPVKNDIGLIAGIAQTATPEPLGETWSCRSFFPAATRSGFTCLGVVWENGQIRALPTLGGNNGFATGANNHRQVVGWAENTVHDPTCVSPQVLQFRAVMWGPGKNQIRELPPLRGDSVSAATAINDRGQVVGISGACGTAVGGVSAAHAVLWEKGRVIDIGNLGGVAWNTPMAINEHGDIVGFSNVSADDGDDFNARAFLWTRGRGITDLGTLPGDALSQALGINEQRQVVGLSCTAGFASCRAFLWQNGVMTDLNTLVAPGYSDHLYQAGDINDDGEITGQAVSASGEQIAFLAIPRRKHDEDGNDRKHSNGSEVASSTAMASAERNGAERTSADRSAPVALPENLRRTLFRRLGIGHAQVAL